uniref:Uncharacterized protein n=1 Tax=Alexandrium monilatum TaxID=311494 RepID=A0A7S4SQE0_9DINO
MAQGFYSSCRHMANFSLTKPRYRRARHVIEATVVSSWVAVLVAASVTGKGEVLNDAVRDWLGLSMAILIASAGIPEGNLGGAESPPTRRFRVAWASALFMGTTVGLFYPWLSREAKDFTCSYWYHQDIPMWGEEKRRFNLGVFWADCCMGVFVAAVAITCVLRAHPPSSFTRCAVRFICSIWLECIVWMLVAGQSLCGDPLHEEMLFVRSVGRSLAMFLNGTNLVWVSMLILRRMKALDMALKTSMSPRRRLRSSSNWMWPLLVGFGLMNLTQFAAVMSATFALQHNSYAAYQLPGAILHTVTDVCLIPLTVLLWYHFKKPLHLLQTEAEAAGAIPSSEAKWALQNLKHERNMIVLTMALSTLDITVRCALGFFPHLQKALPGFMVYICAWDTRNCTDAATIAALCGFVTAKAGNKAHSMQKYDQVLDAAPHPASVNPEWAAKVEELAGRGFRLENLLDFTESLLDGSIMPSFNPEKSTTNDVVRQAIIPQSRDKPPLTGGKAMATVWSGGEPVWPERMVTHSWANLFLHLVAAVTADALEVSNYFEDMVRELSTLEGLRQVRQKLGIADRLGLCYWVCAFSVNQHAGICAGFGQPPPRGSPDRIEWDRKRKDSDGREHPTCSCREPKYFSDSPVECEMNKFDDMIEFLSSEVSGFKQLVAVDREYAVFTRAWCVAELHRAHEMRVTQKVCLHMNRVLDVDADDLSVYKKLATLTVTACQASRPQDKEEILNRIPDKQVFDEQLQEVIFGSRGLLRRQFEGFGVLEAAARTAFRVTRAQPAALTGRSR